MANYDKDKNVVCSFCGRPVTQVGRMVAGPDVYICRNCIEDAVAIFTREDSIAAEENKSIADEKLPTPKEIVEALSDFVIEQDSAKKILAVAVYNHYKRIREMEKNRNLPADQTKDDVEIQKSNII
ncbi:MAG: ATP-dependent Clp protease ATP-binding subunit ClpX, partial [Firmicutes bacterium]|nr:ATP-dependent Clp protease ATP-binding subunit ClpX [Bacillota bacterium]